MITKEHIAQSLSLYRRKEIPSHEFPDFRRAAVLIPIFPSRDELSLLLTVRTHEVETHKGQISFPGGMQDETDKDFIHTALREAREELHIEENAVEILGMLDDHATPTNFIITPVVGYLKEKPSYTANPSEVAEVLEVPLSFFMNQNAARTEQREVRGKKTTVWHFQYGAHDIWGATARMIKNLMEVIGENP